MRWLPLWLWNPITGIYQALASAPLSHHGIDTIPPIGMPMKGDAIWSGAYHVDMCSLVSGVVMV